MIYMPSVMRPAKGHPSDSLSAILSTTPSSEPIQMSASQAASEGHRKLISKAKQLKCEARHALYHRPPHRSFRDESKKRIPISPSLQDQECYRLSTRGDNVIEKVEHSASDDCAYKEDVSVEIHDNNALENKVSRWTLCSNDNAAGSETDYFRMALISDNICKSCPALNLVYAGGERNLDLLKSLENQSSLGNRQQQNVSSVARNTPMRVQGFGKSEHLLNTRLMYFPQMNSKLHVRFKHEEVPENYLALFKKPTAGVLLPWICGRDVNRYSENVPVIVERKISKAFRRTSNERTCEPDAIQRKRKRLDSIFFRHEKKDQRTKSLCLTPRHQLRTQHFHSNPCKTPSISTTSRDLLSSVSSESSSESSDRIVLNVSGLKFETWTAVLDNHPDTLLGNAEKRKAYYDAKHKEYFFDRHRPSFEAIFNYYQYGGRLKRPIVVSDDVFLSELEFFEIEQEAIESYKKHEGYVPEVIILPENPTKRKLWLLFEYPETSMLAFCFSVASVLFTVTSIILFCVETLPVYAQTHCEPGDKPNFRDPFFIIETMCTVWFTFEILIRFVSCPSYLAFIKDVKNWVDLAAIVPYYITLINVLISFSCEGAKSSASLAFLRVIRLIRVFKLTKHSSGLQVLVLTFKESIEGLGLFLVAFIVCILVFSSTIYYVEIDRKGSQIESIPDAFWWAVITMCTVGYGDKVPKGPLGKVVGSVCAVAGVLTLAIPVPIITENFNKFYAHKTGRTRR
ncbi:unnamed protein product [Calicophoron daubneyi]|uniref:BTB domain-containing protein n=1 Tax=Calicophoron daubneyi TaxID=300641 RepID=A0AAV2T748_CALDB